MGTDPGLSSIFSNLRTRERQTKCRRTSHHRLIPHFLVCCFAELKYPHLDPAKLCVNSCCAAIITQESQNNNIIAPCHSTKPSVCVDHYHQTLTYLRTQVAASVSKEALSQNAPLSHPRHIQRHGCPGSNTYARPRGRVDRGGGGTRAAHDARQTCRTRQLDRHSCLSDRRFQCYWHHDNYHCGTYRIGYPIYT